MRLIRWILILGALLIIGVTARSAEVAPDFKYKSFTGDSGKLSDFDKPVVVNFWAVWCPFCLKELPDIQKVYNDYKDNVVIISIVTDSQGDPPGYVKKKKYDWIFAYSSEACEAYNVGAIPLTIFIDSQGKILGREEGQMSEKELRAYLERLK
jgi:thiol-disulfide isomerase/thioredoxin